MVLKVLGQAVVNNLLEDGDKAGHEVLVAGGRGAGHVVKEVEGGAHDAGVLIAEGAAEFLREVGHAAGGALKEAVEAEHGLLADNLARVGQLLLHQRGHGGDHLGVDELADGRERHADLHHVAGLEVALHGVDEEVDELVLLVQQRADGQVAHALLQQRVVLRKLDGVDVAKLHLVPQHLAVHQPDEVLSHLTLRVGCGEKEEGRGVRLKCDGMRGRLAMAGGGCECECGDE